jgi:hypothetical protein
MNYPPHLKDSGIPTHTHVKTDDKGEPREHQWRAPSEQARNEKKEAVPA